MSRTLERIAAIYRDALKLIARTMDPKSRSTKIALRALNEGRKLEERSQNGSEEKAREENREQDQD